MLPRSWVLRGLALIVLVTATNSVAAGSLVCPETAPIAGTTTTSGTLNVYWPATASAAAGAKSITVGTSVGTHTIAKGDLLLVIQMQGAKITTTNSSAYGSNGTTGSGYLTTGLAAGWYE